MKRVATWLLYATIPVAIAFQFAHGSLVWEFVFACCAVLPLASNAKNGNARPLAAGIDIRRWSEQDYQAAAAVITAAYRGHIDSEINDQYRTIAGSLRFLNNIVRFPGCGQFDGGSSFIAYHRPTRTAV